MMKKIYAIIAIVTMLFATGCSSKQEIAVSEKATVTEVSSSEMKTEEKTTEIKKNTETNTTTEEISEEIKATTEISTEVDISQSNDEYVGEYVYENDGSYLVISKNDDGSYYVHISLFRLADLDNAVGTVASEGLKFSAIDPSGNPMEGLITIKDDVATVTYINATWAYIHTNDVQEFVRGKIDAY